MATAFTWTMKDMICDWSDGFISRAEYRVEADDGTTPDGNIIVEFERPAVLKPFEEIDEPIVQGWVRDYLDLFMS